METHKVYGLSKEQYEDIVAPYKTIIFELLKQSTGQILLTDIKSEEFKNLTKEFNIDTIEINHGQ